MKSPIQAEPGPNVGWLNTLAPYILLLAGTLFAWLPLLGNTALVADDFIYTGVLSKSGVMSFITKYGIWRLSAIPAFYLHLANPGFYPLLVLATHLASVLLLYAVVLRLYGRLTFALLAGLAFGMIPFGYQALTWLCVYPYVIAMTLFLLHFLALLRAEHRIPSSKARFLASTLMAFVTVLSNECLFFPVALLGLVECLDRSHGSARIDRSFVKWTPLMLAPSAGCLVWAALYYSFPGWAMQKHVAINPNALISVYFHMYSLADVFQVWFSPVGRSFIFEGWSYCMLAGIVLCLLGILFGFAHVKPEAADGAQAIPGPRFTAVVVVAMLLGCSLIYVFAGGFSLDNRKKYPLIPFLLLGLCWLLRFAWKRFHFSRGAFYSTAGIMVMLAAPSAWIVTGVWKHETRLNNTLADFIVRQNIRGDILVRSNPDLHKAWPKMMRTTGYRFDDDWVINCAITYRGGNEITVASTPHPTVIEYDPKTTNWFLVNR